jgi:hypothetical protein
MSSLLMPSPNYVSVCHSSEPSVCSAGSSAGSDCPCTHACETVGFDRIGLVWLGGNSRTRARFWQFDCRGCCRDAIRPETQSDEMPQCHLLLTTISELDVRLRSLSKQAIESQVRSIHGFQKHDLHAGCKTSILVNKR